MPEHGLKLERLHNPENMTSVIRVYLAIAGLPYRFQIEEPRLGDNISPFSVHPKVMHEVGSDIIDTQEKHYRFVYWSIYCKLATIFCGQALENTMENIVRIFLNEGGNWDNTREERLIPQRRVQHEHRYQPIITGPPPPITTLLTRAEIEWACSVLGATNTDESWGTSIIDSSVRRRAPNGYCIPSQHTDVNKKAWQLLKQTIGNKPFRDIELKGYFEVKGKRGNYRFHKGKQGGVTFVEMRKYGERIVPVEFDLCIQSQVADMPEGDVILSRYLTWQEDEEKFLQIANFRRAVIVDEANVRR